MTSAAERPTSWWLATLERRKETRGEDPEELRGPIDFESALVQQQAIKFFNAAYRAEESGLAQAHALADGFRETDPELSETLRLYGDEEGWHRELLTEFLEHLGGSIQPMGRTTTLLYRLYGRAQRMETILLTNLMFETIGSTTYRMTLGKQDHPTIRAMLTILTRDEAFHVPLNVHFLRRALAGKSRLTRLRLQVIFQGLFAVLVALPIISRKRTGVFDRISTRDLSRGYARELARVFRGDPGIGLRPPRWIGPLLGLTQAELDPIGTAATGADAVDRAADRERTTVEAL
jgi:hypothetical protein